MKYQSILVEENSLTITIQFNRLEKQNSLNKLLLTELIDVLDQIENNLTLKILILKGQEGVFCTGMDFSEIIHVPLEETDSWSKQYMLLLKRLALIPKITIAVVNGKVLAGGMGILAACDVVISSSSSQFGLPEALWGLLPANVLPYLIRKIGFQKAYYLTLSTKTISANEAFDINLVDFLTDNPDELLQKQFLRFSFLEIDTIKAAKLYFRKLWILDENVEQLATAELTRLLNKPHVRNHIKLFLEHGKLPWEKSHE